MHTCTQTQIQTVISFVQLNILFNALVEQGVDKIEKTMKIMSSHPVLTQMVRYFNVFLCFIVWTGHKENIVFIYNRKLKYKLRDQKMAL